ncbi:hypothetical protein IFR23_17305 [Sphingomonas sp. CFBP 13603]|uniref:hypothetical protein n=1 Tax=Sphingomonas sp. CFBP 13603 TaxID=2774040 RepID=UPI00186805C7|nr:hypothetical protein [Sphingomonas sp. CFBP 13603]MBE2993758.1 hypothetical protein [Sphingomonas sp. CFBP 13603]
MKTAEAYRSSIVEWETSLRFVFALTSAGMAVLVESGDHSLDSCTDPFGCAKHGLIVKVRIAGGRLRDAVSK